MEELKERLKAALDRMPPGISESHTRWMVDQFLNEKKDWSFAFRAAYDRGIEEGVFQARRELLHPVAQEIIDNAIHGEGVNE